MAGLDHIGGLSIPSKKIKASIVENVRTDEAIKSLRAPATA